MAARGREDRFERGGQPRGASRCRGARRTGDGHGSERGDVGSQAEESIVKLRSLALFGAGYVLGTRAGRERYGQIVAAAQGAGKRLDDYSQKLEQAGGAIESLSGRLNGVRARLRDYSVE